MRCGHASDAEIVELQAVLPTGLHMNFLCNSWLPSLYSMSKETSRAVAAALGQSSCGKIFPRGNLNDILRLLSRYENLFHAPQG